LVENQSGVVHFYYTLGIAFFTILPLSSLSIITLATFGAGIGIVNSNGKLKNVELGSCLLFEPSCGDRFCEFLLIVLT